MEIYFQKAHRYTAVMSEGAEYRYGILHLLQSCYDFFNIPVSFIWTTCIWFLIKNMPWLKRSRTSKQNSWTCKQKKVWYIPIWENITVILNHCLYIIKTSPWFMPLDMFYMIEERDISKDIFDYYVLFDHNWYKGWKNEHFVYSFFTACGYRSYFDGIWLEKEVRSFHIFRYILDHDSVILCSWSVEAIRTFYYRARFRARLLVEEKIQFSIKENWPGIQ